MRRFRDIVCGPAGSTLRGAARNAPAAALQQLDSDHDGTVDLNEAKAAAGGSIAGIVITGTLDRRELRTRVNAT
jgi:hypothetical protein